MISNIQRSLIAGTLVLAPLGLTIWVFISLVGLADRIILLLPKSIQPENVLGFPIPGLGILLTLIVLVLVGMGTRYYAGRRIVDLYEGILKQLPIVSSLYSGLKQLLQTIFSRKKSQFSQAVLVEYPRKGIYSIAFVTNTQSPIANRPELVSLFLPTTPNPTSGFFLMVARDTVSPLNMTIEEAFKMIMSAGLVVPENLLRTDSLQQVQSIEGDETSVTNNDVVHERNP